MIPVNILDINDRAQFRQWLIENHASERECWVVAKRGKTQPEDALWYLDAVEEALCFGWIDSTLKSVNGEPLQRFGPRTAFKKTPFAWENFQAMPSLYQRVRIDNIHRVKSKPELFNSRLQKLIEASAKGEMIGDWHDFGRLLDY